MWRGCSCRVISSVSRSLLVKTTDINGDPLEFTVVAYSDNATGLITHTILAEVVGLYYYPETYAKGKRKANEVFTEHLHRIKNEVQRRLSLGHSAGVPMYISRFMAYLEDGTISKAKITAPYRLTVNDEVALSVANAIGSCVSLSMQSKWNLDNTSLLSTSKLVKTIFSVCGCREGLSNKIDLCGSAEERDHMKPNALLTPSKYVSKQLPRVELPQDWDIMPRCDLPLAGGNQVFTTVAWDFDSAKFPFKSHSFDLAAVSTWLFEKLRKLGNMKVSKPAVYLNTSTHGVEVKNTLSEAGWAVQHAVPTKEAADRAIMTDIFAWLLQCSSMRVEGRLAVCIVGNDSDYGPFLSTLRNQGVTTILIGRYHDSIPSTMLGCADVIVNLNSLVADRSWQSDYQWNQTGALA